MPAVLWTMRTLDALMLSKALRPLRRSQFADAVIVMENKMDGQRAAETGASPACRGLLGYVCRVRSENRDARWVGALELELESLHATRRELLHASVRADGCGRTLTFCSGSCDNFARQRALTSRPEGFQLEGSRTPHATRRARLVPRASARADSCRRTASPPDGSRSR